MTGDWMGPTPPAALSKDESGTWSVTLGPLEANVYTYGFLVEGGSAVTLDSIATKASGGSFWHHSEGYRSERLVECRFRSGGSNSAVGVATR